jgi:hypothetical protein
MRAIGEFVGQPEVDALDRRAVALRGVKRIKGVRAP